MEDVILEIQKFFSIDRILSIIGIGVTIFIAVYIYKVQRDAQATISRINRIFDTIAKRRLTWFDGHIGNILRNLREECQVLNQKVGAYQQSNSRENLNAVVIASDNIQSTINHLYSLYERDIDLAKDYISDPYMVAHFIQVIPTLGMGIVKTESEITRMASSDLARFRNDIEDRINEIQGYIDRIDEEVKNVNS